MVGQMLLPGGGIRIGHRLERNAAFLGIDPKFRVPEEDADVHLRRLLVPQALSDPLYKTIYRGFRDILHRPQLPPLAITSKPVDAAELKGLNGLYAGNEVRAGIGSLLVNAGLIGLVLLVGSFKPVRQAMNGVVTLVAPSSIPLRPMENKAGGGGGGGGGRPIVRQAAPPRAIRQFISPVAPAAQTKLQSPILLSAMPPDFGVPAEDSNLSGLLAIAGGGYGSGIGSGSGGGIGTGSGSGLGGGIGNGLGDGVGNGSGGGLGGQAYRPGGGVTNPIPIYSPEAEYPREARKADMQGSVLLSLVVDPTGRAVDIQVIQALGMGLDEAAREAVSKWRFKPGTKDGKPVPVLVQVEVTFRLL